MRHALEAEGIDVRVFASKFESDDASDVREYRRFAADAKPLSIYHHAIAWPQGVRLFSNAPGTRMLRYHNVTPAHFFFWHSLAYTAGSVLGQWESSRLATHPGIESFVSASEFSTLGLTTLGAPPQRCHTLPPFEAPGDDVEPDPSVLELLRADARTVHVLFVGRLLPHKGHGHLIRALAAWREKFEEPVRLHLVGGADRRVQSYARAVTKLCERLDVDALVDRPGAVSPQALEAYYRGSTIFACASEHEGFCLPLLEAMRRGLPVVALGRTAVPETVGEAGKLLADVDPETMAAAWRQVALVDEIRRSLIEKGRARAREHFDLDRRRSEFLELARPLLE